MKTFFPALVAAACLAGCTHAQVQFGSGAASAAPPGPTGVSLQGGGPGAVTLIGLGIMAAIYGSDRGAGDYYGAGSFAEASESTRPPPLAPTRRVSEQDCSRPIEDPSANLRCR